MFRINFHYNQPTPPKEFKTKKECKAWIMKGLRGCEGAERDHYVDMLTQLELGKKELNYN